jgi:hypothetical protein
MIDTKEKITAYLKKVLDSRAENAITGKRKPANDHMGYSSDVLGGIPIHSCTNRKTFVNVPSILNAWVVSCVTTCRNNERISNLPVPSDKIVGYIQ